MSRVVICMKWGTLYEPDYVNVLYNAVRRNLDGAFRFVCLTDDPAGLLPEVERFPIPDIGLREDLFRIGAWPKVAVFARDLYGLTGRALFIDLDTILCGDIAPFFTFGSGFVAIDEGRWERQVPSTMSSIFAFDLGALGYLVDDLRRDRDEITGRHGLEQRYLHAAIDDIGYWPDDWLVSYKRHLRRPVPFDRILPPKAPGPGVRAIIFHGRPRPIDLVRPGRGNRDVFPHYLGGQVGWARDYWTANGGAL
jgi:hypothetical protein